MIAFRRRAEMANPLIFFGLQGLLYPLGVSPELTVLSKIGAGIIWISALLATVLNTDSLFRSDLDDGCLEQLIVSGIPLPLVAFSKVSAHWVISALPILVIAPLLGIAFGLRASSIITLELGLALGTPVMSFIAAIGASLTLASRQGALLLPLLVLPLYIPILIFATSAISGAEAGLDVSGQLYMLASVLVLTATVAPLAIAAGVRISVS